MRRSYRLRRARTPSRSAGGGSSNRRTASTSTGRGGSALSELSRQAPSVRLARLVQIPRLAAPLLAVEVDVRIDRILVGRARADFEIGCRGDAAVDQMMTVGL